MILTTYAENINVFLGVISCGNLSAVSLGANQIINTISGEVKHRNVTPLQLCSRLGFLDIAMMLVDQGAIPSTSCLEEACDHGRLHLFHYFYMLGTLGIETIIPKTVFTTQGISALKTAELSDVPDRSPINIVLQTNRFDMFEVMFIHYKDNIDVFLKVIISTGNRSAVIVALELGADRLIHKRGTI